MADKLGLGPEVRRLKLGDSFSRNGNTAFHTFRYDFKPASMDTKKMAKVHIGPNNQTTVEVPHVDGSGTSHTVFRGPRKPYTKECVLVIDQETGEVVLEKLTCNVQLKKTRAEGSSRMQMRPITPVEQSGASSKKGSPPQKQSPNLRPPHSPMQSHQTSPSYHKSPTNSSRISPVNQRSPSMPSLVPPPQHQPQQQPTKPFTARDNSMPLLTGVQDEASEVGILSDSSNESSSSGSSSSSDSSDCEGGRKDLEDGTSRQFQHSDNASNHYSTATYPGMSRFSQLSEDLQLSESESEG